MDLRSMAVTLFWHLFSITAVFDLAHELHVVLAICFAGFKSFLEGLESVPSHWSVVW